MTAATAARHSRMSAAINRAFGEAFAFTARKLTADVNLPRVADPGRPPFTAVGVWTEPSKERNLQARGHASDHAQSVVISAASAKFEIASLAWLPIEGDICTRSETSEVWAVSRAVPDGFGWVVVHVTAKRR